jgi:hypothetical protein
LFAVSCNTGKWLPSFIYRDGTGNGANDDNTVDEWQAIDFDPGNNIVFLGGSYNGADPNWFANDVLNTGV